MISSKIYWYSVFLIIKIDGNSTVIYRHIKETIPTGIIADS